MKRHRREIADVFRDCGFEFFERYGKSVSVQQHRVFRAVATCRTKAMGGHVVRCRDCGHSTQAYNSCRNRHCPKCLASARYKWTDARESELLPVPYFHVVFTIPNTIASIALQNPKVVYTILFRTAWQTVRDLGRDPKHLGAKLGMLAVLHTWGQNLSHHPHVHCVVPGGGMSDDRQRWINVKKSRNRKRFLFPVKVMSRVFRGKFIQSLKSAFNDGRLNFHGKLSRLRNVSAFESLLNQAVSNDWVVYCKRPFGGPKQVLKYLARYTHRVAIANSRLVSLSGGQVAFRWKDYSDNNTNKVMKLDGSEFIRRFLTHVLPSGYVRIRHYGFLSNRNRNANIEKCRELLDIPIESADVDSETSSSENTTETALSNCCSICQSTAIEIRNVKPVPTTSPYTPVRWLRTIKIALWDTA